MDIIDQIEESYYKETIRARKARAAHDAYFTKHGREDPHLASKAHLRYPTWYSAFSRFKDLKEVLLVYPNEPNIDQKIKKSSSKSH